MQPGFKSLYYRLLNTGETFRGFFSYQAENGLLQLDDLVTTPGSIINKYFQEKVCRDFDLETALQDSPLELAYALAFIAAANTDSIPPAWLIHRHLGILPMLHQLRYNRCGKKDCLYCSINLEPKTALKNIFGFDEFRSFESDEDMPLQELAVRAAFDRKSFLAVFPTGGGKSLTFQLPALMMGEACRTLTVVISPLQSLMKDQVDSLKERHERTDAAAINSLLSPLERAEAIKKVVPAPCLSPSSSYRITS